MSDFFISKETAITLWVLLPLWFIYTINLRYKYAQALKYTKDELSPKEQQALNAYAKFEERVLQLAVSDARELVSFERTDLLLSTLRLMCGTARMCQYQEELQEILDSTRLWNTVEDLASRHEMTMPPRPGDAKLAQDLKDIDEYNMERGIW